MEEQAAERLDPIEQFPEEIRATVHDLTQLGYLTRQVDFCGHRFVLQTLRPHFKHAIAQVHQPFRGTLAEPDTYAALYVAMALSSVNGDAHFCPQTTDSEVEFVRARLRWLTGPNGFWQPTIDYLMAHYTEMEAEVTRAIAELHRLSQGSRDTSQPSPDSSNELGLSDAEIDSVSPS